MKPEFDGKRFSFPGDNILASPVDVLRWAVTRKPARWPRDLSNPPADNVIETVGQGQLRITYINHATVLIQGDGLNILTDPVFSKRVSPVKFAGPKRYRPVGLTIDEIPTIHCVLISHTHYDHLDLRSLNKLCVRDSPVILSTLNTASTIYKATHHTAKELSWWDSYTLNHVDFMLLPARHWTSRKLGDQNKALWGGYSIHLSAGTVYFAGDTGYGNGDVFKSIYQHIGSIHCALLPIGAYEPRWFMHPQHMNPAEAVQAFRDLKATHALGIHHGTFQLTDEAHDAPVLALEKALDEQGISTDRFRTLANGQAWDVD